RRRGARRPAAAAGSPRHRRRAARRRPDPQVAGRRGDQAVHLLRPRGVGDDRAQRRGDPAAAGDPAARAPRLARLGRHPRPDADGRAQPVRHDGQPGGALPHVAARAQRDRRRPAVAQLTVLDPRTHRRHRIRNVAQAALLFGGMAVVLGGLALLLAGAIGVPRVLLAFAVVVALRPRVPPRWLLSMYGARPLPYAVAPELHHYVAALAQRAGLPATPRLYYVASPMANAFAVGRPDDAALAVTDGLLRSLTAREVVGVLAHEVGHIRADDLWVMSLGDAVGRLTHALAYVGLLLLLLSLPLTAAGGSSPLWPAVLLTAAPTVVTLLQLALSRSREYDADLEAAALTGDPEGLASALVRLERLEGRIWERVIVPRRRAPDPLLLRTHPPTAERVRRLRQLVPREERRLGDSRRIPPAGYP